MVESSIGPYRVLERLGSGGMGDVFLAEDTRLHRKVALKTLAASWSQRPDARERLLREARAAAGLNHPNIAAIYDVVEAGDVLHIVMEYVEGEPLFARLGSGGLPPDEVTAIALQLCDAMAVAHGMGVIHRDLKPGNILITPDGRIKVLDFGLAKTLPSALSEAPPISSMDSTPSNPGHIQGTPAYMSPEQLRGQAVDHRADIYSLGVLLFELLTGRRPFQGSGVMDLGVAVLTEATPSPSAFDPLIPASLSAIVVRAMAREREERFQSVAEMRDALRRLPPGLSDKTTVSGLLPWAVIPRPRRRSFRSRRILWVVGLGLAAVAALTLMGRAPWLAPSAAFADRDWLLVADVDNESGQEVFEGSLREALVTALEQSSYVNVVTGERVAQVLARMRREKTTRIDAVVGREICQREGFKALLLGTIRRSGAAFQIRVQVIEAATGRPFFADSEQFTGPDQAFGRIDALSGRVRQKLGEPLSRIAGTNRPLARVTTGSLEALQLFSKASEAYAREDVATAEALLRKALEIDPEFALAHLLFGQIASTRGIAADVEVHWTKAYELRDGLPDRERPFVVANYERLQGRYGKAAETLKVLVEMYPDDVHARRELAVALDAAGLPQKGAEQLRRAVRIDPDDTHSYGNLGLLLVTASDFKSALGVYDEATRRGLSSPYFGWGLGLARLGLGDAEAAVVEFGRLDEAGPPFASIGRLYRARTEIYRGRFDAAQELLEAGIVADRKAGQDTFEVLGHLLGARLFWLEGRRPEARREVEAVLRTGKDAEEFALRDAGLLLAQMGDLARAGTVMAWLRSGEDAPPFRRSCLHLVEAESALASGHAREAVDLNEAAASDYPSHFSNLGLARAYRALGDRQRAAQALERVLVGSGEILRYGFPADIALAHLDLARLRRQLGDEEGGGRHYEAFMDLWKDASDLPLRQRAEREWGKGPQGELFEKRKGGV